MLTVADNCSSVRFILTTTSRRSSLIDRVSPFSRTLRIQTLNSSHDGTLIPCKAFRYVDLVKRVVLHLSYRIRTSLPIGILRSYAAVHRRRRSGPNGGRVISTKPKPSGSYRSSHSRAPYQLGYIAVMTNFVNRLTPGIGQQ